ncbi:MAG TPA: hypothetical protein VI750_12205 [Pyrinomonadaceae bacterium]|nr:hypothetical protein [Pyrinomonadaceae bacterium]
MTWLRDPFDLVALYNFSQDQRTRVMLLAANIDLTPGDTTAIVTSLAQDSQGNGYPLTVEYIGKVPEFDWITEALNYLLV